MAVNERIRWTEQSDGGWLGHAGTIERSLFMIIPPFLGRWELYSTLPGWDRALLRGDVDEIKDHAERWLEEFVSSLGAVWPEPIADNDCPECGFGLPRHDKDCSRYRQETAVEAAREKE
jgi:hypothetical protein